MNIDDQVVGQHNKFEVPELVELNNEMVSNIPLSERIKGKNPRIRFEAACELLKDTSKIYEFEENILVKLLADSHPGVQEKALDILFIFLQTNPKIANEELITTLIEKCIVSTKNKVKGIEALLMIAELENTQMLIYDTLKNFLNTKTTPTKVMIAILHSLTQLLSNFGNSVFPIKDILKQVSIQASSTNLGVKNEAMEYLKESYKWIKDKISPFIENLKPIQQEELKKSFGDIKVEPKKFVKGQIIKEDVEVMKLVKEEVVVLGKFSEKWCNEYLELKKWSEKRDKLLELSNALSVEKVKSENFTELGSVLKRILKDSNVVVVNMAIKIIGQLSKTLRTHFSAYARQIFGTILQKCKDKKTVVEAQKCLEDLKFSLKLHDMLEELKEGLNDKSPQVKSNLCNWLENIIFPNADKELLATWTRELVPALVKLTEDAVSEVRNDATSCLNSLKKFVSDNTLDNLLKGIHILNKTINKVSNEEKKKVFSRQNSCNNLLESKTIKSSRAKVNVELKEVEVTQEEAEKIIKEKITIPDNFTALEWKAKQQHIKDINIWLSENPQPNTFTEALAIYLKSRLKDFKESNVNVMKEAMLLLQSIADTTTVTKTFATIIVPGIAERIGEPKYTELCQSLLLSIADSATPSHVSTLLIQKVSSSKSVNTIRSSLTFFMKMLDDYGVQLINVNTVLEYAKSLLSHSNAQVRVAATKSIVLLYSQVGSSLKPLIASGLKETTYKAIETELAAVKFQVIETKRVLKGVAKLESEAKKTQCNIDEVLPTVNISSLLTSKIINGLTDSTMKVRQDAKEEVEKILSGAKDRIQPIGLSSLMSALKTRMSEPCKNLTKSFISLVGRLALSLGTNCKQYSKIILKPLMLNLADKQTTIREEALIAINKFVEAVGLEVVFNEIGSLLEKDNPDLRREVLTWIIKNKEELLKLNIQILVKPLIEVMQDRSKEIRELGEQVIGLIINKVEYETFIKYMQDLKPAIKQSLMLTLDKYEKKKERSVSRTREVVSPRNNQREIVHIPRLKHSAKGLPVRSSSKSVLHNCLNSNDISKRINELPINEVIVSTGNKKERANAFPVERKVNVEELKAAFKPLLDPTLLDYMFSGNSKQVESIKLFIKVLKEDFVLVEKIADLIFKWFTIVIKEEESAKLVFDFLWFYFYELSRMQSTLCDIEAFYILPLLCEHLGGKNDVKRLVMKVCDVYLVNKLCEHLMLIIESKNNKARLEGLVIMKNIVSTHGVKVIATKDVKIIVSLLDNPLLKLEVIEFLAAVYKYKGESIWSVIDVSEQIKETLCHRFNKIIPVKNNKKRDYSCNVKKGLLENVRSKNSSKELQRQALTFIIKRIYEKPTIEEYLEMIKEVNVDIEVLINFNKRIKELLDKDIKYADKTFITLVDKLKVILEKPIKGISNSFLQHLFTLLNNLCSIKVITSKLHNHTVLRVLEELLVGVDKMKINNDMTIANELNTIIIRFVNNTNPTTLFISSLDIYKKYKNTKISKIAINCILKILKYSDKVLALDFSKVLLSMHEYLIALSSEEQANNNDDGIRLIKSSLSVIIKHTKDSIWKYYDVSIGSHTVNDMYVKEWINIILNANDNTLEELKVIFEGFISPLTFQESIRKLSVYLKNNPDIDINEYLSACSPPFKQLIANSLKKYGTKITLNTLNDRCTNTQINMKPPIQKREVSNDENIKS